jgi:SAM-dependent methyltransferase
VSAQGLPRTRYIHGTHPEEQGRLSTLNRLMNEAGLKELGLRGGESIIDFGSGLGQLTRAMARAAGAGGQRARVVGIERSEEQLAEALRQARAAGEESLAELRAGDVLDPPLAEGEWGSFDVAHARFVLEHVADPQRVVAAMVRAVKPGGRVVLQDDDHDVLRLWPVPAGFESLWDAYIRSYDRNGTDPFVGRRLVSLLHEAGAAPFRSTWIFFGACAGEPRFVQFVENLVGILAGAREAIVHGALLGAAEVDAALEALRAWGGRPEAAMWFAICWAEGVKR